MEQVERLQKSLIMSRDGRVTAVTRVARSKGSQIPGVDGVDGVKWTSETDRMNYVEWLGKVKNKSREYKADPRKTVKNLKARAIRKSHAESA